MGRRFLDNVHAGKNDGWRYVAVLGVAVYYWLFWAYFTEMSSTHLLLSLSMPRVAAETIGRNIPFLLMLIWLAWALPRFHERSLRSLVNAESAINLTRVSQGFVVWAGLLLVNEGIALWLHPHEYVWQFQPAQWFWLVAISVLFVPIQTSIEELLFRGYLMQAMRLFTRRPWMIIVLSSVLFSAPHWGNPEMLRGAFVWGALSYFAWGVIFSAITLKDNGLELALGVHAANNIIGSVIVTTPDSVIPAPALLVYIEPIDPRWGLVSLLSSGLFFYCLFFGGMPKRTSCAQSADTKES